MRERIVIALLFLIFAGASLSFFYLGGISSETSGILANLGTGFIGTALTVLIVDWLYERRTCQASCRSIAISVMQELDHAIWVWQGDSRQFDIDELYTRISLAEPDDPFPPYTQNLFMRLGTRCVGFSTTKVDDLAFQPRLAFCIKQLSRLEQVRDANRDFDFVQFKSLLLNAVESLSEACNISRPQIIRLPVSAHRITSKEHQHYRHYGRQIDGSPQPIWTTFDPV
ncbi:hypothetical protein [Cupriavidus pampae]|uniref:DUF4760 domain-containing protein n=1 Tax=Cupriavidus pampae TaxID=659251 RepID=A0ABM8Y082_9BURK|nr:hypothetical protein [Cupriavidus pampae]CAG9186121.1 hypothetical protein LMG32289_06271 [Cupriavidus pampae]